MQVALLLPFALLSFMVDGSLLNMSDPEAAKRRASGVIAEEQLKASLMGRRRSSVDTQAMKHVQLTMREQNLTPEKLNRKDKPIAISTSGQLIMLLSTPVFVCSTLALSALFFVVTGIQFWATDFLIEVLRVERATVLGAFAATSATAPVFGVVFGGWIVDYVGGYEGTRGQFRISSIGSALAAICVCLALPAGWFKSSILCLGCVWFVLFFGGAIVPGATGMVISSVDPRLKAFSSAMSMPTYNICGYSAGTILPGLYMEYWKDMGEKLVATGTLDAPYAPEQLLAEGVRIVLYWSVSGLLFMGLGAYFSSRQLRKEGLGGFGEYSPENMALREREAKEATAKKEKKEKGEGMEGEGAVDKTQDLQAGGDALARQAAEHQSKFQQQLMQQQAARNSNSGDSSGGLGSGGYGEGAMLRAMSTRTDNDGDGMVNKRELILALRKDPALCDALQLPAHIRQEDRSRDQFQRLFNDADMDDDQVLSFEEFERECDQLRASQRAQDRGHQPNYGNGNYSNGGSHGSPMMPRPATAHDEDDEDVYEQHCPAAPSPPNPRSNQTPTNGSNPNGYPFAAFGGTSTQISSVAPDTPNVAPNTPAGFGSNGHHGFGNPGMVGVAASKFLSHGSPGAVAHGECSNTAPLHHQLVAGMLIYVWRASKREYEAAEFKRESKGKPGMYTVKFAGNAEMRRYGLRHMRMPNPPPPPPPQQTEMTVPHTSERTI